MRVKGDEHYVNMKREKSKEREKEKYFLRCARSLLSSASVSSSFPPNRFAGVAENACPSGGQHDCPCGVSAYRA